MPGEARPQRAVVGDTLSVGKRDLSRVEEGVVVDVEGDRGVRRTGHKACSQARQLRCGSWSEERANPSISPDLGKRPRW